MPAGIFSDGAKYFRVGEKLERGLTKVLKIEIKLLKVSIFLICLRFLKVILIVSKPFILKK